MNHARRGFIGVKMFLPNAQENRDIFRGHHVPFAENRALALSRDDLGDILAEHAADSFLNRDSFNRKTHRKILQSDTGKRGTRTPQPLPVLVKQYNLHRKKTNTFLIFIEKK